ncbi:MAG: methyltransferase domain-containing protein [Acidobacteriia bacterium]|nr:methyltransferase domain-containing protein [Terriglobia bacterium]
MFLNSNPRLPIFLLLPVLAAAQGGPPINRLAPPVPSPQNVVVKMLEAAGLKPGEVLYDLGSGDGRVLVTAAQQFGAKAVGVEMEAAQVQASNVKIRRLKLEDKCRVIEGDLLKTDLSEADVVTIYLLTGSNDLLRPNLEKYLKPGARVVSHDYQIRGWTPVRVEKVEAYKRIHSLYIYERPTKK